MSTKTSAAHALPIALAIIPENADIFSVNFGVVYPRDSHGEYLASAIEGGVQVHLDGPSFLTMLDRLAQDNAVSAAVWPEHSTITGAHGVIDGVTIVIVGSTASINAAASVAA